MQSVLCTAIYNPEWLPDSFAPNPPPYYIVCSTGFGHFSCVGTNPANTIAFNKFDPESYAYQIYETRVAGNQGFLSSTLPPTLTQISSFTASVDTSSAPSDTYTVDFGYQSSNYVIHFTGVLVVGGGGAIALTSPGLACCQNMPSLAWTPIADTSDTSFLVKRDGTTVATVTGEAWTETTALNYGQSYTYTVTGVTSGIVSNSVVVTPVRCSPPAAPAPPTWNGICTGPSVVLTWSDGTILQRDGVTIYTGSADTFTDTDVVVGTSYSYTLADVNCGGTGAFSTPLVVVPCVVPGCGMVPVPQASCPGISPVAGQNVACTAVPVPSR